MVSAAALATERQSSAALVSVRLPRSAPSAPRMAIATSSVCAGLVTSASMNCVGGRRNGSSPRRAATWAWMKAASGQPAAPSPRTQDRCTPIGATSFARGPGLPAGGGAAQAAAPTIVTAIAVNLRSAAVTAAV